MGSGAGRIHLSSSNSPIFCSHIHDIFDFGKAGHCVLLHAINIDTQEFILSNFKASCYSIFDGNSQILNFLIVDFKHRSIHFVLDSRLLCLHSLKYFVTSYGDNALIRTVSNHAVGFPRTRLSVCEQTTMIALPSIV